MHLLKHPVIQPYVLCIGLFEQVAETLFWACECFLQAPDPCAVRGLSWPVWERMWRHCSTAVIPRFFSCLFSNVSLTYMGIYLYNSACYCPHLFVDQLWHSWGSNERVQRRCNSAACKNLITAHKHMCFFLSNYSYLYVHICSCSCDSDSPSAICG